MRFLCLFSRPVRLRMGFHTNMKSVGKRFPFLADYEVSELMIGNGFAKKQKEVTKMMTRCIGQPVMPDPQWGTADTEVKDPPGMKTQGYKIKRFLLSKPVETFVPKSTECYRDVNLILYRSLKVRE